MSYEITRWFEIDAGHRIQKHESKCKNIHGHRYRIGFVLGSSELDPVGRVRDFGTMKEDFGDWLDEWWDHGLIVERTDPITIKIIAGTFIDTKHFIMDAPPTAENMAKFLYERFRVEYIQLKEVIVYETPNCCARYPAPTSLPPKLGGG